MRFFIAIHKKDAVCGSVQMCLNYAENILRSNPDAVIKIAKGRPSESAEIIADYTSDGCIAVAHPRRKISWLQIRKAIQNG